MAKSRADTQKIIILGAIGGAVGAVLVPTLQGSGLGSMLNWFVALVLIGFVAFVAYLLLFKNKKTSKASAEQRTHALQFQAMPDRAVLYVYRHQYVGMLAGFDLCLDNMLIGQTRGYCFYRLELMPGVHQLSGDKKCEAPFVFEAHAGQVIYVEQEMTMSAMSSGYRFIFQPDVAKAQGIMGKDKMYLPNFAP
jgi:hypothetical protein